MDGSSAASSLDFVVGDNSEPAPARPYNRIEARIVTTYEELLHAYAVRSICFMEEHGVSAQQTFDGNDYQSTHIIVYADDQPIGTTRIRWFKDFAKFERTSFRKAYRNLRILRFSAQFAFDHAARKGYDKVIIHAQPKYAQLWQMILGFRPVTNKPPLVFKGHGEPYVELEKELEVPANAITANSDIAVLFRTEGAWDVPAPFESAPSLDALTREAAVPTAAGRHPRETPKPQDQKKDVE